MGIVTSWKTTVAGIALALTIFTIKLAKIRYPAYHDALDSLNDSLAAVIGGGGLVVFGRDSLRDAKPQEQEDKE